MHAPSLVTNENKAFRLRVFPSDGPDVKVHLLTVVGLRVEQMALS